MSISSFFNTIHMNKKKILGMNARNLQYIYLHNKRKDFPIANDKLKTKALLKPLGVSMSKTLTLFDSFYSLSRLEVFLLTHSDFVIKPAKGSGGGGIIVIVKREDDRWISHSGKGHTFQDLRKHIADILFGVYSFGLNDVAMIEERIIQHETIDRLSPMGLADVRVILHNKQPIMAMMRVATQASDGKANLHQGGVGIGVDISTGMTMWAEIKRKAITHHPDTQVPLIGVTIPFWDELIHNALLVAQSVPLNYVGADISIAQQGPIVLEINARPGLEIQNANRTGLVNPLVMSNDHA